MLKYLIVVIAFLLTASTAAHVKIGNWDPVKKLWNSYNPACDNQCTKAQGVICGANVRQCCVKDQCITKSNFQICNKKVENFECDQGKRGKQLDEMLREFNSSPN